MRYFGGFMLGMNLAALLVNLLFLAIGAPVTWWFPLPAALEIWGSWALIREGAPHG